MKSTSGVGSAYFLAFIFLFTISVSGQPQGYVQVPHEGLPSDSLRCNVGSSAFTNADELKAALAGKNCTHAAEVLQIDLARNTLAHYSAGGDCHMRVAVRVYRNESDKQYKVIVNNISGGCRAGGRKSGWIVFEKARAGYEVRVVEVRADRTHGTGPDSFRLPKPPPVITRNPLTARELDMMECLPVKGQTRWIIRDAAQLEKAETGKNGCREHLRQLEIDYEKETLVQYSFASGHCARPPGLTIEAFNETSTDRTVNRYLLKVRYDHAGNDHCKVFTTYPLWVVVPRLPDGFSFNFEAAAK